MDHRSDGRRAGRLAAAVRWLLLLRVWPTDGGFIRLVDLVILPIGVVVAAIVCIPVLIGTILAGAVVGTTLTALGLPNVIGTAVVLLGLAGGVVLSFIALLRISRRLPASIRRLVYEDDDAKPGSAAIIRRDPSADSATLVDRLAPADAALAPGPTSSDDDNHPR